MLNAFGAMLDLVRDGPRSTDCRGSPAQLVYKLGSYGLDPGLIRLDASVEAVTLDQKLGKKVVTVQIDRLGEFLGAVDLGQKLTILAIVGGWHLTGFDHHPECQDIILD